MLMIVGYAALLAVSLVGPAGLAAAVLLLLHASLGWWASVPGAVVLLAGIAVEAAFMVRWLGRVFERMEPVAGTMT
jgi:hypothetical protein